MKILTQRGKAWFLIREKGKHYMFNTDSGDTTPIEDPQMVYKQGYCEDPHPTKEQETQLQNIADRISAGVAPNV